MANEKPNGTAPDLHQRVESQAARKLKARRKPNRGVWAGVRMFGMVGWSVAVPALAGAAFGIWLDDRFPGRQSWTLTFLLIGIIAGCLNAWYWVQRESRAIHKDIEDDN